MKYTSHTNSRTHRKAHTRRPNSLRSGRSIAAVEPLGGPAAEVLIAPDGAKQSLLDGATGRTRLRAIVAILTGAAVVFFLFPGRYEERLLARYHAEDTGSAGQSI